MPNGDIVSGCSDGVVRVFSESEDRWASSEELKAYDDTVASQALPSQQVGDVKKSDLPGLEALNMSGQSILFFNLSSCLSLTRRCTGKKSGEVKMIRNNDIVEAHQVRSTRHYNLSLVKEFLLASGMRPVTAGRRLEMSSTL